VEHEHFCRQGENEQREIKVYEPVVDFPTAPVPMEIVGEQEGGEQCKREDARVGRGDEQGAVPDRNRRGRAGVLG